MINLLKNHIILFDTSQPRIIKTDIHHVINTGNHSSINAKPYFKTIEQRKNIQHEIDNMLKAGIIIPSHSPWSSPVVLLKKPNGEFRFIIDYRKLNSITTKDCYPQPTVEELINRLGGHSWFTKLDLKSGYYQISIHAADKSKTAFITQDGLYQFQVLPMGLMNAPPSFQRVMNHIIGYNRWHYILVYLDDILVFSNSFDDHMKHLQQLFNVLNTHQFTLNPAKCSIAQQSIEFLSHTITKDSIVPSKQPIQAILDMPGSNMREAHRKITPVIPSSVIFDIPESYQQTFSNERILLVDLFMTHGKDRVLVCSSDQHLELLFESETIFMDETFDTTLANFKQV
ncbi:unnamed protein product [Rotaria magnacalcarata]|uniref:Reverse transcriptase domain-containing protein n=1 Tax=Rotaria magnacalcarata TaxID=392030 RepID=A0A816VLR5_9BILA|nr:unnamed protein product [Rotaria magnacalcarata]